jgi:hypothetical protein
MTENVRMLTVPQTAKLLGVTEESVRVAARAGHLKGFRDTLHLGGPWLFTSQDVEAYRLSRQRRVS